MHKHRPQRPSRRSFLGTSGGLLTALGVAGSVPSNLLGQTPTSRPVGANDRVRIGCIGVGNQGRGNLRAHLRNVVAVCEVDRTRLGQARETVQSANGGTCLAATDYRRLLDSRDVDAVVNTTPDHWHALITVDACQAGKHVYCEKPLTLTVAEGRTMVRAARRNRVIVQTGSQQRSDDRFRQACELVRNGRLGDIREIRVGIPGPNFSGPPVPDSDPPAELLYDTWLGPAPQRPYNQKRVHYLFRFFWDYSGGQLTNFGAHHLDIVQWALGMDESGPTTVEATASFHPQNWYEVPQTCEITYTYANGVRVVCGMRERGGVTFHGARGRLYVNRGRIEADPADLLTGELPADATRLYVSRNHHNNWLECVRSGRLPICDVEIGHRSATVCHLGNIAVRSGRRVTWDPSRETIVGDEQQAAMLSRPYRAPWRLPEIAGS